MREWGPPSAFTPLRPGKAYPIGFAIFDDSFSNRRHHVTLPLTVGLGVDADVKAVKVPR